MRAKVLSVAAMIVVLCGSFASSGCGPGGGAAAGKITKEAAAPAGKDIRQWQQQNR